MEEPYRPRAETNRNLSTYPDQDIHAKHEVWEDCQY